MWEKAICLIPIAFSSPIVDPKSVEPNNTAPVCHLPFDLTPTSGIKFLEDCDSIGISYYYNCSSYNPLLLDRFTTLPTPVTHFKNALGVHPKVCCPQYRSETFICLPSEPCHEDYPSFEYPEYGEGGDG